MQEKETAAPLLTLNNGVQMPVLGLGVYQSSPQETVSAVETAIANGYRLIDTAATYGNEADVGEGILRCGIDRSEIFVTTKLWISDYGYDAALKAFDASLRHFGFSYIDLYLLHWPVPSDFQKTVAAYKAAEQLLAQGKVRAIGVSNFNPAHLTNLIRQTDIIPAVNQVELHPYFIQSAVREANAQHGIITQSWSPLGGVKRYRAGDASQAQDVLTEPIMIELARTHRKTPAQIVLRWQLQHGFSAIPKSVKPERIAENFDVFDFTLTPEEMASIDGLDIGQRGAQNPDHVDTELFPFTVEDVTRALRATQK